ncbi:MFS transporter [Massilia glaciei]|uniref:MFS transporter n=1 Tax=Massilia glaciei TaxID=1524097 RepID=A0A2U2HEQ1_9BURK|nr:MFS transporter [Massilia glaciei]
MKGTGGADSATAATAATAAAAPSQSFNLGLFFFAYYAHAGTFATYASLFFAARGMSAAQIGILMSLIQVMRIFGPNLWGWVADHTRRRVLVLRLTAMGALVSFGGIFLGQSFGHFFAAMVLLNLFTSAQGPLSDAVMLSSLRGDLANFGRVRLWGSAGFVAAVMAAAYGLEWYGVDALPWIAGLMLLFVVLASLRLREAPPAAAGEAAAPLWSVLRQPAVLAFFASTALMVSAHTSLYVFYSLYLEREGYGKPVIGAMWSLGVLAEIVFFYFQGALFRRFGVRRVLMVSFGVALLRFAVVGAGGHSLALLVFAQLLHAFTFAAHHSASVVTMQRWFAGPLQARGQALYMSVAYGVGGTLGGLLMTLCWERAGPDSIFVAAAVLSLAGGVVAALSLRWQDRADQTRLAAVSSS